MFGFLNVNKPANMTSHDVISRLRKALKIKQIGHSGTLDPLAVGVLPIGVGKATRLLEYLSDEKVYVVELQMGKISSTFDIEGQISEFSQDAVSYEQFSSAVLKFIGEIEQIPPAHSAVHYNGKRLYELAREGIIPEDIPRRIVNVDYINILDFNSESKYAKLEISCSKGTYIRSIVHDIGQYLGVGALMISLIRTQSSNFLLKTSVNLDDISSLEKANQFLINPLEVLSYKHKILSDIEFSRVRNGNYIENDEFDNSDIILLQYENSLVAVAEVVAEKIVVSKVLL